MDIYSEADKIDPDETVKAVYRETKRALTGRIPRNQRAKLSAQIEFLERIYRL